MFKQSLEIHIFVQDPYNIKSCGTNLMIEPLQTSATLDLITKNLIYLLLYLISPNNTLSEISPYLSHEFNRRKELICSLYRNLFALVPKYTLENI